MLFPSVFYLSPWMVEVRGNLVVSLALLPYISLEIPYTPTPTPTEEEEEEEEVWRWI